MESGHGSGTNTELNTHPDTRVEKALAYSRSFTSSSSSEDTFELNGNEITENSVTRSPPKQAIPCWVFEASKSTKMEWSTASAESLFSIGMGNMSFKADARKSCNVSVSPTEAAAAQTMQEVIRENEERISQDQSPQPVVAKCFAFDHVLTTQGESEPKPHQQTPKKAQTPKSAQPKWRSCFSWCPFCK